VVPNTPLKEQIEKISFKEREDKAGFILYYAGKIDHNRYIDSVIKALPKLLEKIPEIKFNIAGNIAKACDPRIWAKQYGVEKQVRYLGQLSYEDMMQKMKDADICISLLPSYSEELNRTIVTKIYQYIQLQKPMIVSRTDYIQEFVRKHKIGSVVNEEDPQTIYKEVLALYKNKETMNLYAQNCAKIKESLIWEKTVQALLNLYRDMDKV
jgi:glycosyltransferase involved in cell wall biosynthesis